MGVMCLCFGEYIKQKRSDSVLSSKQETEPFHSKKLEWSHSIQNDSPTKHTLKYQEKLIQLVI
jgi:hypothetical protein